MKLQHSHLSTSRLSLANCNRAVCLSPPRHLVSATAFWSPSLMWVITVELEIGEGMKESQWQQGSSYLTDGITVIWVSCTKGWFFLSWRCFCGSVELHQLPFPQRKYFWTLGLSKWITISFSAGHLTSRYPMVHVLLPFAWVLLLLRFSLPSW